MRGRHGAPVIVAVRQAKRVAEFMHRLDQESISQHIKVFRQAIKLLPQSMVGDDSGSSANLGLTEHEGQNRYVKVEAGDGQQLPCISTYMRLHCGENLRRMVLLALGVHSKRYVERRREDLPIHLKLL